MVFRVFSCATARRAAQGNLRVTIRLLCQGGRGYTERIATKLVRHNEDDMKFAHQNISGIGRNLRTLARQGQINALEAAKRIKFSEQSVDLGLEFLTEAYTRQPDNRLLEAIGDFYVNDASEIAAKAIFKSLHHDGAQIHVTNLIYAGLPATRALVEPKKKLLFIPIPKCGSSSVKNYFTEALFGKTYGETVHFQHPELYRTITPEDLKTTYADYYSFSVVRDPVSRLVSYYMRNVFNRSLRREAHQEESFMDIPTQPGPFQFVLFFHQYRQLFKDFRHHTDPIDGFLGPFHKSLSRIYQMSELPELQARLSEAYGREISDDRSMVSRDDKARKERCQQLFEKLRPWYQDDDSKYF